MKENKSPNNRSANKQSPYPTPLKLFDEMQTPGTVYPTSLEELRTGKARVRSQFVYPTNNSGDNVFRCNILEAGDFSPKEDSSDLSNLVDQSQNGTPTPEQGLKKISNGYDNEEKSILSSVNHWYGNGIPNSTTKYKEVCLAIIIWFLDLYIHLMLFDWLSTGPESKMARNPVWREAG